jgi:hypothetical protein
MKTMPSSSDWLAPQSISFSGPLPLLSSMWAVSWILVRPVEIESRCQSADTGPDSGYSLVWNVSSKTNLKSPFQLEDDVQVSGSKRG